MKSTSNIETNFNKFLKISLWFAIILITIGGLMHILQENMHIHLKYYDLWLIFIKAGIFLLVILQILRIVFIAITFINAKEITLALMSLFIIIVLSISLLCAFI
jgi:hypothetical protein